VNAEFKNGDDKIQIDIEPDCNSIEIWNDNSWSTIALSDAQLEELRLFLNKWSETNEKALLRSE